MRTTLSFLMILCLAGPVAAQPDAAGLGAAAQFTAQLQQLYQDGMAISFALDDTETLIDSFNDGEIDEAGLTRAYGPAMARDRAAIDAYGARLSGGLTAPSIGDPRREKSMQGFAAMVEGLADRLEAQYAIIERLHRAATAGDSAAYRAASAESLALTADMILDENIALGSAMQALPETHPQHGLNRAIIGGNEAVAVALRILEATYRNVEFDAAAYARGVEEGLRRAEQGIGDGEQAADALAASFAARPAVTRQDRYSKEFIVQLAEAYHRAFEVERRVAAIERDFLDFLQAVSDGSEPDEDGDFAVRAVSFQADLELATADRMKEQMTRLQMVQEYARTLQSMSEQGG